MDMGIELVTAGLSVAEYIGLFVGMLLVIILGGAIIGIVGSLDDGEDN